VPGHPLAFTPAVDGACAYESVDDANDCLLSCGGWPTAMFVESCSLKLGSAKGACNLLDGRRVRAPRAFQELAQAMRITALVARSQHSCKRGSCWLDTPLLEQSAQSARELCRLILSLTTLRHYWVDDTQSVDIRWARSQGEISRGRTPRFA
jgi:hypothetical protein